MARIRGPLPFNDFRQRVRRHRPSEVLMAVAELTSEMTHADHQKIPDLGYGVHVSHFALAAIARAAITYGTEFRDPGISRSDLIDMCAYYAQVEDPALTEEPGIDRTQRMLLRMGYEQFGFQFSAMENIGRTVAVLVDHQAACAKAPSIDDWSAVLGVTLEEFMRIGFTMHVAGLQNRGRIEKSVLMQDHVAPLFTPHTAPAALTVVDRLYGAPVSDLREISRGAEVPSREKWSLNPLLARPVVDLGESYVMPSKGSATPDPGS